MKKWLAVPPQPEIPRNEMLLKLSFGERVTTEILIRYVERMAEEHRTLIEVLERAERDEIDNQQYPAAPYWRMAAHYGQMEMRAHLRWAEETLAELNKIVRKQRARVETHKEKKTCSQMRYSQRQIGNCAKNRRRIKTASESQSGLPIIRRGVAHNSGHRERKHDSLVDEI